MWLVQKHTYCIESKLNKGLPVRNLTYWYIAKFSLLLIKFWSQISHKSDQHACDFFYALWNWMINIVACTHAEPLNPPLKLILFFVFLWTPDNYLILALYLVLCRPQESSQCFYDFLFLSWFPFRISGQIIQHQKHFLWEMQELDIKLTHCLLFFYSLVKPPKEQFIMSKYLE